MEIFKYHPSIYLHHRPPPPPPPPPRSSSFTLSSVSRECVGYLRTDRERPSVSPSSLSCRLLPPGVAQVILNQGHQLTGKRLEGNRGRWRAKCLGSEEFEELFFLKAWGFHSFCLFSFLFFFFCKVVSFIFWFDVCAVERQSVGCSFQGLCGGVWLVLWKEGLFGFVSFLYCGRINRVYKCSDHGSLPSKIHFL